MFVFDAHQRRALTLLARSGHEGMTEGLLVAHGVSVATMVALVEAGLATAHVERLGRPKIKIARVTITTAGQRRLTTEVTSSRRSAS